ncbi:YaaA family protein (plasmid) [Coraliomargarita sp. W4R53]
MLILLPPSETKRTGGAGRPLDMPNLAYPSLAPYRESVVDALVSLSGDEATAARVLKLSAKQIGEVSSNAQLRESRTMAAVDRYTGVLFDALDALSLDSAARRWLGAHVRIHSAPFGPVGALDNIPAYRLGAAASLPTIASLKRVWAEPVSTAIARESPRFVLDMRSEAYVALGPVPAEVKSVYVRVVSQGADGAVRALNHFNKHAKGELVRTLAIERPRISSTIGFVKWAGEVGLRASVAGNGELQLFV